MAAVANQVQATPSSLNSLNGWASLVSEKLINLDFVRGNRTFEGNFTHIGFDDSIACRLTGVPHRTTRSTRLLKEVDSDFMLLLYIKRGSATITHGSFEGRLKNGNFFLIDGTKPHMLEMEEDFEHLAFRTSRSRILAMHRAVSALVGQPISAQDGDGSLASGMMEAVMSSSNISNYAALTVFEGVVKTLADHLVNSDVSRTDLALSGQEKLLARVLRTIDANCANPNYCCNVLAADVGVSRRYIDRLLSTMGASFGKLLLEKRLARCHEQLTDSKLDSRPITTVAFENGFNDLSHFSRTFRTRYGCSAREVRRRN